jgi:hypothetical protein
VVVSVANLTIALMLSRKRLRALLCFFGLSVERVVMVDLRMSRDIQSNVIPAQAGIQHLIQVSDP